MRCVHYLLPSAAVLVLAVCPAFAQPPQRSSSEIFQRLKSFDADNDGKISKSEAPPRLQEHFDRFDANGDGLIEEAEVQKMLHARAAERKPPAIEQVLARLKAADANGDGKLSKEEVPERFRQRFDRADANGDGKLDEAELKAAVKTLLHRAGEGATVERVLKRLMESDADGDGKISKSEAPERMAKHFDRLDANSDGQLDQTELKRLAEKIAARAAKATGGAVAEQLRKLKAADRDGDGKLSQDEVPEGRLRDHFSRVDANGDGYLDQTELKRVAAALSRRGH